ncbi:MAG TPA: MaoC/PaaZ C-terminal domain-containing protein [Chloroflexota bacterium]|nr:MaoC/PaaZ C-terminal domain-containing protein [Chloroflexota bacterium]
MLKTFGGHDPARFQSIRARFSQPVFPGETVITEMWDEGNGRILFRARIQERGGVVAITHAAVEMRL